MQLIERYGLEQQSVSSREARLSAALCWYIRRREPAFFGSLADGRAELTFQLPRWTTYEIVGRIALDVRQNNLMVEVGATNSNRTDNFHTASLVRLLLQARQPVEPYHLKVHPQTGRLSCGVQSHLPESLDNYIELLELAEERLNAIRRRLEDVLTRIRELSSQSEEEFYRSLDNPEKDPPVIKQSLEELKKYVLSSSGYAWKVLRFRARSLEKNRLKQQFRQHLKNKTEPNNCLLLSAISNGPLEAASRFFLLTDGDDQYVHENYVQKPQLKPIQGSRQIEDIELTPSQLKELKQTTKLQLPNGQCLRLRKLNRARLQKESVIMNELFTDRFPTLPQYYNLKNDNGSWRDYTVQRQTLGVNYHQFLQRNSVVMPLVTVLELLNDMARTMMFLRNNDIVSNSLKPSSVTVTKGLHLEMDCLWNAFHPSIEESLDSKNPHEPELLSDSSISSDQIDSSGCRNDLPYISHAYLGEENSHKCESSDVFSLGSMMFRTLFRRDIFDIKPTTIAEQSESDSIVKMCRRPVFAFDKFRDFQFDHMRLLGMFVLRAASHCVRGMQPFQVAKPTESCSWELKLQTDTNSRNRLIERRPHLDWVVAVVEHVQQYFQREFVL